MIIRFSPLRSDAPAPRIARVSETALEINDVLYDFGGEIDLSDGGPIERTSEEDGTVVVSVFLPHGPYPPENVAFPVDVVDPAIGPVSVPSAEPVSA